MQPRFSNRRALGTACSRTYRARQMGNGGKTGRVDRGLLAGLLVLDRNPFGTPITQVHETTVKLALINGEIVYRAPQS